MRPRFARAAAALAIATLAAGCGPRAQNAPQPATQVRPRSTGTLRIVSPAPGAVVTGPVLRVRILLKGATVVPETSMNLTPDRGHIHLSLDGKVVSMAYGIDQDVNVTAGDHLLQAEFVATDHFPFNPRVITTATFTVK